MVGTSSLCFHKARALRHTSALLRYNASSLRHRYERAQFTIHFIKEIKSLVPPALLRYISTYEFLRTRRLVLLRTSLVFLKINKCLYVSTMHSVRFLFLISHHPVETFYQICHKLNHMFETSGRLYLRHQPDDLFLLFSE